jgi:hypothetical protein
MNIEDEYIKDLLADQPLKREALGWLTENSTNTIGVGFSNQISLDYIRQIYKAGAREVIAFNIIEGGSGGENTGQLIIMLPAAMQQRATIFKWYNTRIKARGWAAVEDKDQDYLFMMLD